MNFTHFIVGPLALLMFNSIAVTNGNVQASTIKNCGKPLVSNKCPFLDRLNAMRLQDAITGLHTNVATRLELAKRFKKCKGSYGFYLRQGDGKAKEEAVPANIPKSFFKGSFPAVVVDNFCFKEATVDGSTEVFPDLVVGGAVSLDLPKTLGVVVKSKEGGSVNFKADLKQVLKRLDFLLQYRNVVLQSSVDLKNEKMTIDLAQRLENLFQLAEKDVKVSPKLQLVLQNGHVKSRFCLALEHEHGVVTPIIYPLEKNFELLLQSSLTDNIKVGLFFTKDRKLMLNISYSGDWGDFSWQSLALRFVFPELAESNVQVVNEISV